ncbi:MAG: amidohydrolase, partial [Thermoanaerobaculia bacterium]|nr:amidohydrolase [Thermoanaerobaculia bacterium]
MQRFHRLFSVAVLAFAAAAAGAQTRASGAPALGELDRIYPDLDALYMDLHRSPELSKQEANTAAKMAARLKALGFEVTSGVGGHGVVGILRNGGGPTVMLRTDLDGLPVEEKTGLPYASKATAVNAAGEKVSVMHACGHDIHMTSWIGAATLLAGAKDRWRGTLMMVGQPAEEGGAGALSMLKDGLFTRFPKPDFAFAIHDNADAPSGKVVWTSGFALANVDAVDVTIFGKGGHGAYPHKTVDPIVIAARAVVALQTIVGRENDPLDPAVVTVGSFHGGTKHNIIPDEVKLQLTVRSYKDDVRKRLLAAIERIIQAEAAAAGAPKPPEIKVSEGTPATYNDPALTKRLASVLAGALGKQNIEEVRPVMGGEDFSEYGRAGVPAAIFWVGAVEPKKYEAAKAAGTALPSLHSPLFAPDRER